MLQPDDIDLLSGRSHGHLATLNADGTAHITPVWVGVEDDGEHVLVNTVRGRKKDRNVSRDPRVAICVQDLDNAYRWISINGTVVEQIEGPEVLEQMTELSLTYTGRPWDPVPGQVRVLYKIRPDKVIRSGG